MEYIGYADANAFVKISGISKDDLEKKSTRTKSFKKNACTDLVEDKSVI